ncbi:hypothetical protein SBRCBS47491_009067 [Sporothrix bragantina]|uniref:HTH psq-type domain-containing protein n=1 Tax=Sporothrix bragantina TaxID=671064 RepID=A0ABP0CUY7_9PEZI
MPRHSQYAEVDMANAVLAHQNGASIRQAAFQNNVPYTSLRSRLNGNQPPSTTTALESLQELSRE